MQELFFTTKSSPNTTTALLDLFPNFPQATPTSWILNFHHWCLLLSLPWRYQDKPTAVPQFGEGEISSTRRERIFPLGKGKEMEKYLEHIWIALTSLVTTCQTAQITCDHHGEAPKKGKDGRQNLGGVLVCWSWGFFVGYFGDLVWVLTAQDASDVLLSDSC